MKLVPYFLTRTQKKDFTIVCVSFFLSHAGKSVWKTEEPGPLSESDVREAYFEPNGLSVKQYWEDTKSQIAFAEIDPSKSTMSDFYTWEEAMMKSSRPECWRRYYFIQDKEGLDWWSPKGLHEAEIQEYGNVNDLFCLIQKKISN